MELVSNVKMASFSSWARNDEKDCVTLMRFDDHLLFCLKQSYGPGITLRMSFEEAAELGADIMKLLPSSGRVVPYSERESARTNRFVPGTNLNIIVNITTQGEPFEEGVSLDFSTGDYETNASIELSTYEAWNLSKALA